MEAASSTSAFVDATDAEERRDFARFGVKPRFYRWAFETQFLMWGEDVKRDGRAAVGRDGRRHAGRPRALLRHLLDRVPPAAEGPLRGAHRRARALDAWLGWSTWDAYSLAVLPAVHLSMYRRSTSTTGCCAGCSSCCSTRSTTTARRPSPEATSSGSTRCSTGRTSVARWSEPRVPVVHRGAGLPRSVIREAAIERKKEEGIGAALVFPLEGKGGHVAG